MRRWVAVVAAVVAATGTAAAATVPGVRSAVGDGADAVARWATSVRRLAATVPAGEAGERVVTGESASLLLLVGEGAETAVALVSVAPGGAAAMTILPQDTLISVPGFGEYRLGQAMLFDGPELAALSVVNQFGIRLDRVVALPPGSFAAALPAPLTVDLAAPFFVDDGTAIVRQLPAGASSVDGALLEEMLVSPGAGDAFEWIQRQGAVWRAVLAAVAADVTVADRLLGSAGGEAPDILVTAAAAGAVVATIPVELADDGGSRSALTIVGDRVDGFVAERLGHLLLRPEGRPRIEILNGNGRIGSTRVVADVLVRAGFRLVRTDNADTFDHAETLVIAQGQTAEGIAREIVTVLGHGLLFLEVRAPSGVVDVSIIVGADIPAGEG